MKSKSVLSIIVCILAVCTLCTACRNNQLVENGTNDTAQNSEPAEAGDVSLPNATEGFAEDENINQTTIDGLLGRSDTVYRDMRMILDPANYEAIGGKPALTQTIKGFKVVPFPYIATLPSIPVDGGYTGETLFAVLWNDDNTVAEAVANYEESFLILEDLFPKDKALFLMCGGGGYAGLMKALLIHFGWDPERIYNVGANWAYEGNHAQIIAFNSSVEPENPVMKTWLIDYAYIDFSLMHKL
jgi:hypothetical protein